MKTFYTFTIFNSDDEIIHFFQDAIKYRETHKDESDKIARHVFDATHQDSIKVPLSAELERVRYEFGALEAPGQSDTNEPPDVFADKLWEKLDMDIKTIS